MKIQSFHVNNSKTIKISWDKKIKCRFLSYLGSQLDKLQPAKASGCVHSKKEKIVLKMERGGGEDLVEFLYFSGSIH